MEQNNSVTGRQEAGPVGFGGIQNGGGYDDQGIIVGADALAASASAAAADAGADSDAGAGGVAIGGAGGGVFLAGAGGVAIGAADGGAAAAVAGPSFQSARGKKSGNHRHSQQQINAMEAYFKDHPHLDESQRNVLANSIRMDPEQVKFWFQNKRNQVKIQREREEPEAIRSEIEVLKAQNQHQLEALNKSSCPQYSASCTQLFEERNRLRSENIPISEETELLQSTISRYIDGENLQDLFGGFGAKRWVLILERQCQLRRATMSVDIPSAHDCNNLFMSSPEGRKGIMRLAERLVNSYYFGITSLKTGRWSTVQGNFGTDVVLKTRRVTDDSGLPNGVLLGVDTSFTLSLAPRMVFEFLRDHKFRKEWDIFAEGNDYELVCQISRGEEAGNCVSLYKVPMRQGNIFVLQESWTDPVASHIVFAPIETGAIDEILGGGNPDVLPLLPSGLSILPGGPSFHEEGSSGTLLTVSFQVLTGKSPLEDIDLEDTSQLAEFSRHGCEKIKHALGAIGPNA